jgi:hypothetical protein
MQRVCWTTVSIGGCADRDLDTVQKLCLDSLTWELMRVIPLKEALISPLQDRHSSVLGDQETLKSYNSRGILDILWRYSELGSRE